MQYLVCQIQVVFYHICKINLVGSYHRLAQQRGQEQPVLAQWHHRFNMPWKSRQQEKWGNSPSGKKAMGQKAVNEFNQASKGAKLPKKVKKK
jgi:hypothetical protein